MVGGRKKLSRLKQKMQEVRNQTKKIKQQKKEKVAKPAIKKKVESQGKDPETDLESVPLALVSGIPVRSAKKKKKQDKPKGKTVGKKGAAKAGKKPGKKPEKSKEKKVDTADRKPNSTDVHRWFKVALRKQFGKSFIVGAWNIKQKTLAKQLIDEYGPELMAIAVEYFVDNWDDIVDKSGGRLRGVPTVNLLWGMRDQIFGAVQTLGRRRSKPPKAEKKNSDEFKGKDGKPVVGW